MTILRSDRLLEAVFALLLSFSLPASATEPISVSTAGKASTASGKVALTEDSNRIRAPRYATTDPGGTVPVQTTFLRPGDAYIRAFGEAVSASADGDYVFQVTDRSGRVLLSTDPAACRIVRIEGNRIVALRQPTGGTGLADRSGNDSCQTQDSPPGVAGPSEHHDTNSDSWSGTPGALTVQLMPYLPSPSPGHVHKVWLTDWSNYLNFGGDPFSNNSPVCVSEHGKLRRRPAKTCAPGQTPVGFAADPGFGRHSRLRTRFFRVLRGSDNRAPNADAGPDQTASPGATVVLDGSASTDPDGDPLTYSWSMVTSPAGSTAVLNDPLSVAPWLQTDAYGTYLIELVVNDGTVDSAPDTVEISVANSPPVANAGPDQSGAVGQTIHLNGSSSSDVDGDPLTYLWQIASQPATSTASLNDPTLVMPSLVIDQRGTYVVELVVNDGFVDSLVDIVTVSTANSAPNADAGPDQSAFAGQMIQLDGSASSDVDGDPLTYFWAFASQPAGSSASLSDPFAVMPVFDVDLNGTYVIQLIVNDGLADSAADTMTVSALNSPPTANAGSDQSVALGALVQLDGSASSDVDGDPLTYFWSLTSVPSGSSATVTNPASPMPTFAIDSPGVYVAQLIVNDGFIDSVPDTVTIDTINTAPIADAGANQALSVGQTANLDGSASSDSDGDPISFTWSFASAPAASTAILSGANTSSPTFDVDASGDYVVQLIVNDGQVDSAPDSVTISTLNTAPIADAGADASVVLGATAMLDGSASSDADGDPISFFWSLLSAPAGSGATLSGASSVTPNFIADVAGTYVVQLIVNDGLADSAPDTVVIDTLNSPPTADAGPDQSAPTGSTVILDGSASTDLDGDPLTFSWALVTAPASSTAALSGSTTVMPTLVLDLPGTYEVELVVSDGLASSAPDRVTIDTSNSAPTADAGPSQSASVGDTANLDGSGSSDPDGDPLTYQWTLVTVPSGSSAALVGATTVMPTFVLDVAGTYQVELIVNDGTVDSAPSTVEVSTVNTAPVADAGPAQTLSLGATVQLDGSGSTDVDGDLLTYQWSLTSVPVGSAAALTGPTTVMPTFVLDLPGTYVAQLVVNDGTVSSTPSTVVISTLNSAPVAAAGPDQTVPVLSTVMLDGSASSDADGDPLTASWSFASVPIGSTAALSDPVAFMPTFVADVAGIYVVQLIVNDGQLDSVPSQVVINTGNSAPIADAGPAQNVPEGSLVQLDGSNSNDPDGDPLSFSWSFTSMPAGSTAALSATSSPTPSFVADLDGLYVVQLIVNDGTLDSLPTTVCIISGTTLALNVTDSLIGLGRNSDVTATLSQPAGAGGQVINLTLDDPIASLSAPTIFFAAGETDLNFQLTGDVVGTTTLRGSGPGVTETTASIAVTQTLISVDTIPVIAPAESVSVAISITDPAPPQGLLVTLSLADPSVATLSTPTLFIPAGQFTPTANAEVTGTSFGSTTLRAEAPLYAPDTRAVTVALEAAFEPPTLSIPIGFTRTTAVRLDSPAPPGGIVFDLTSDDPFITFPSQVTISAGQTLSPTIDVEGVTQGTTTLNATSASVAPVAASVTVTDLPDVWTSPETTVGVDLTDSTNIFLEVNPSGPVDVHVSVPAGSGVLIAATPGPGAETAIFQDIASTFVGRLNVFGVSLGDDVLLTMEVFERGTSNPAGYESRPAFVDVDPSTVIFETNVILRTLPSGVVPIRVETRLLGDSEGPPSQLGQPLNAQSLRPGVNLTIPVETDSPAVVALPGGASSNLLIAESTAFGFIDATPLQGGTANLSLTQPPGFTAPGSNRDQLQFILTQADAFLSRGGTYEPDFFVGHQLQEAVTVRPQSLPSAPIDVQVSVPPGSGVLLSLQPTDIGGSTVLYEDVTLAGGSYPMFYMQGEALEDDVPLTVEILWANTTTPAGYNILPSKVDIDPSGISIFDQDYSTNTFATSNIRVQSFVLFDAEPPTQTFDGQARQLQSVRPGVNLSVPMASDAPGVLTIDGGATTTATIASGSSTATIVANPASSGTANVSIVSQPAGFTVPSDGRDSIEITVTAPSAFLTGSTSSYQPELTVGNQLQSTSRFGWTQGIAAPMDLHVSVPPGSPVLLSTNPTVAGTNSIVFEDFMGGSLFPIFYIQGTALGEDIPIVLEIFEPNTTTPIGFDILPSTVEVDPSGVFLLTADIQTSTFAPNGVVAAATSVLWDTENPALEGQFRQSAAVRGGTSLVIPMQSDAPSVIALPSGATGDLVINGGAASGILSIDPLTAGVANVSVASLPSGLVVPSDRDATVQVTVDAPDLSITRFGSPIAGIDLGRDLQITGTVQLEVAPPNPVNVTVEVLDPSVAAVSIDPTLLGSAMISYPATTTRDAGPISVQGLALGATQIRVTAPGYDDLLFEVTVVPSGFGFQSNTPLPVNPGATSTPGIAPFSLLPGGARDMVQAVRGGASFDLTVTSSDPTVGTVASPITFGSGSTSEVANFSAGSSGSTVLTVGQPAGFSGPGGFTSVTQIVN